MIKTIKIKEDTHKAMLDLGHKGETFDDIIKRLIKRGDTNGSSRIRNEADMAQDKEVI